MGRWRNREAFSFSTMIQDPEPHTDGRRLSVCVCVCSRRRRQTQRRGGLEPTNHWSAEDPSHSINTGCLLHNTHPKTEAKSARRREAGASKKRTLVEDDEGRRPRKARSDSIAPPALDTSAAPTQSHGTASIDPSEACSCVVFSPTSPNAPSNRMMRRGVRTSLGLLLGLCALAAAFVPSPPLRPRAGK